MRRLEYNILGRNLKTLSEAQAVSKLEGIKYKTVLVPDDGLTEKQKERIKEHREKATAKKKKRKELQKASL